jgi:anthranilate synthase component I
LATLENSSQQITFIWENASFLDSEPNSRTSRFTYIGIGILKSIKVFADKVFVTSKGSTKQSPLSEYGNDPLLALQKEFDLMPDNNFEESNLPFQGGACGFVSYDASRYFDRGKGQTGHIDEPDLYFVLPESLLVIDHFQNQLSIFSSLSNNDPNLMLLQKNLRGISQIKDISSPENICNSPLPKYEQTLSLSKFQEIVQKAKNYISAGDIFQVILSNNFTFPFSVHGLKAFSLLKEINPSPFHFYLRFENQELIGASPELMIKGVINYSQENISKRIKMRLVAGTAPAHLSDDEQLNFKTDIKENAEHIMLVDHERNDIGKVSQLGTVRVDDLLTIENYSNVNHLVSEVSGTLKTEESFFSALRACFPIATLSGTPKVRAQEIIAELEGPARGIFGGAIVLAGDNGYFNSCVAIRSLITKENSTVVSTGAGIVHDSNPEREYNECLWKAEPAFKAIAELHKNQNTLN